MSSYENIYEVLNGGESRPYIGEQLDKLSVDQRIAAANVIALAAIAEELSRIRNYGIAQPEPEPLLKPKPREAADPDEQ